MFCGREKGPDTPLQAAQDSFSMWRAENGKPMIDPNPGLVEYVETQNLVVLWKERKTFFRDEEKARELKLITNDTGTVKTPACECAIRGFESLGESGLSFYRASSRFP